MKKNIRININGIIFNIDEDAYQRLNTYLEQLRAHFSKQEGGNEIVDDIEIRIAELLNEKTQQQNQIVTLEDVEEVIKVMGTPSEMQGDETGEQKKTFFNRPKRLFRDPDSRIIGGVGGGMGAYFNTDPLWFRLAFVLSFFVVGPLAYIVFWIAVPMARTTAEKLEMKGEKVNIDNIEKSVKDELKDVSENLHNYANQAKESFNRNRGNFKNTGATAANGLEEILRFTLKFGGVILGIILLFTGLSLATSLLTLLFLPDITHLFIEDLPMTFHAPTFVEMFFNPGLPSTLTILGLVVVLGIPVLGLLVLSVRMIFGPRIKTGSFGSSALLIWFVALFATAASVMFTAKDFKREETIREEVATLPVSNDPLIFRIKQNAWIPDEYDDTKYIFNEVPEKMTGMRNDFRGIPEFSFVHTKDSLSSIEVISSSHGKNSREAKMLAEKIGYALKAENNLIEFDPFFTIPERSMFRAQDIRVRISLSEGTKFNVDDYLDDISYPWYLRDKRTYIVTEGKIKEFSKE
jgi:phage shock protein PspC (stress-responsive transcriptional regulator)